MKEKTAVSVIFEDDDEIEVRIKKRPLENIKSTFKMSVAI